MSIGIRNKGTKHTLHEVVASVRFPILYVYDVRKLTSMQLPPYLGTLFWISVNIDLVAYFDLWQAVHVNIVGPSFGATDGIAVYTLEHLIYSAGNLSIPMLYADSSYSSLLTSFTGPTYLCLAFTT